MIQNQRNVNGVLELIVESTMTAHDHHMGLAEEQFRQAVGLVDDTPEETAYLESIDAWGKMWESAVESAYWTGYKMGQDEKLAS